MSLGELLTAPKDKIVFNAPFIADQYSWVRLTNSDSSNRVGYRIKAEDPIRLGVKPAGGIINASAHVDVKVDYRKFMWDPAQKIEDRLLIEWALVPDGVNEFANTWFDVSKEMKRHYIPVVHNV